MRNSIKGFHQELFPGNTGRALETQEGKEAKQGCNIKEGATGDNQLHPTTESTEDSVGHTQICPE